MKKKSKQTVWEFNKQKKNCITVKSHLLSFLNALIISFSLSENANINFVKKNWFNLSESLRKKQPNITLKVLRLKLRKLATDVLNFVPKKISDWRSFLYLLDFNLIIFCGQNHYKILNQKACLKNGETCKNNLYLMRSAGDKGFKYHYDVIRTPCGYYNKYFCKLCYKTSKSKAIHFCRYVCYMCKSKSRHDRNSRNKSSYCKNCNRFFYGKICKDIHIASGICDRKKVCTKCDQLYIVKKKKDWQHYCRAKDYCRTCQTTHPKNRHYIRAGFKPPPQLESILVFDFETFRNVNGYETPYLCVSRLYDVKSILDESVTPENISFEHREFYGLNCEKEFYEYLVSGKLPLKTVCFAHNGQSFDFYFLLAHMYKSKTFIPAIVMNSSRVMQITIKTKEVELRFIDSLNFIPFPLRKFPKLFGFEDSKSFFPYSMVNAGTINYQGDMPEKSSFEIAAQDQTDFDEFYQSELINLESGDGIWDLKVTATKYCVQDVHVLFCGLLTYLKSFYKITQINPFR